MTLDDPTQPVRLWPTPDEEEEAIEVAAGWGVEDALEWVLREFKIDPALAGRKRDQNG